jgi:lipopolysaccharide transport system permease protein
MYAMPFINQLWLYATPVVYSSVIVPLHWRWVFSINPAVGFVEGFRWAVLGKSALTLEMMLISSAFALVVFVLGGFYFRGTEREFADVI